MSATKTILTFGWSPYYQGSKGKSRKYHFFPNGEGVSLCGHVTLTENKRKNKFIDLNLNVNEKKFCVHCVRTGAPK